MIKTVLLLLLGVVLVVVFFLLSRPEDLRRPNFNFTGNYQNIVQPVAAPQNESHTTSESAPTHYPTPEPYSTEPKPSFKPFQYNYFMRVDEPVEP